MKQFSIQFFPSGMNIAIFFPIRINIIFVSVRINAIAEIHITSHIMYRIIGVYGYIVYITMAMEYF